MSPQRVLCSFVSLFSLLARTFPYRMCATLYCERMETFAHDLSKRLEGTCRGEILISLNFVERLLVLFLN
jgi:hypothetical protein